MFFDKNLVELVDIDTSLDEVDLDSRRIIELQNHPEFQALSYIEQIVLLTGEKLLQIDEKIRKQTSLINHFFKKYGNAIGDISENQKNISDFISGIVKKEITNWTKKIHNGDFFSSLTEERISEVIEERYREEIASIENRLEYIAQQTVKNMDESMQDTMQQIDQLKRFEIKAHEDIQKNQDRIFLLEEAVERQNDVNEIFENSFKVNQISENDFDLFHGDASNVKIKYNAALDNKFESLDDLENYIKKEAKKIAQNEIEKYIHDFNLFSEDRESELVDKLFSENDLNNVELNHLHNIQVENSYRMTELENLLNKQSDEIKKLSNEKQELMCFISEIIKNKNSNHETKLNNFIKIEKENNTQYDEILDKNEADSLIKKQAIKMLKDKIEYLKNKKKELNSRLHSSNKSVQNGFNHFSNSNNSNIIFREIDFSNWENLDEELMKHNYYNGNGPIAGTKITRINNYKINNDIEVSQLNSDAKFLIEKETEKSLNDFETLNTIKNVNSNEFVFLNENETSSKTNETNLFFESLNQEKEEVILQNEIKKDEIWQENSQRLIELENIINKQEVEIQKLKENVNENPTENNIFSVNEPVFEEQFEPSTPPCVSETKNDPILKEIDESIKAALNKLNNLSDIQEKTQSEIIEANKKIEELEHQLKSSPKVNEFEEEIARKEIDKMIQEKYRINNEIQEINYIEEMKKIESERKKIEETLELERMRLLSEIEANRKRLSIMQQAPAIENGVNNTQIGTNQLPVQQPAIVNNGNVETEKKEEVKYVLETPKKKRKQQVFYEIKTHSTPKLTRADLEK